MKLNINIGFIGFGRMGSALAEGAVEAKAINASHIWAYDPVSAAQSKIAKLNFHAENSSVDVVKKAQLIFLCVKPQMIENILASIKKNISVKDLRQKCFVSIAAGVPIKRLEKSLGKGVAVIRVMPNTPAMYHLGMSAVSLGPSADDEHESWTHTILGSVGEVEVVPEKLMDAVTAVSGSGPAYVFYLAEAMTRGAKKLGLSQKLAEKLVNQTILGSGHMLSKSNKHPEELREQVTSPGGTTAAAIYQFDKRDFKKIIQVGIKAAANRSEELSK